jgi:hypothetical protein
MILEIIGMIIGALVAGFIVFSLFSYAIDLITRYKLSIRKNLNITLFLSIVFALIWGEFWGLTPDQSIIRYIPALIIMYFYDRRRRLSKKCPNCKERIKLDAQKCRHCHSELLNESIA